ncbi:hypothetical protein CDAR_564391 [Caerostris darwini]|uniref:Uncharacterized protein n=1 Tax=Caerostris darwini TaxID=1538125 RepID=A0AAV4TLR2_9ARAC|nr:hypothetical protein CDAR_564391 [Caerostris darwini]
MRPRGGGGSCMKCGGRCLCYQSPWIALSWRRINKIPQLLEAAQCPSSHTGKYGCVRIQPSTGGLRAFWTCVGKAHFGNET